MRFKGELSNTEFSIVIDKLMGNNYVGTLIATGGDNIKEFHFDGPKNMMTLVGKANHSKVGEFLLTYQKITQEHIDYIVKQQEQDKRLFGQILIELGYGSQADLDDALRAQAQDELFELLSWEGAEFEFKEEETPVQDYGEGYHVTSTLMDLSALFVVVKQRLEAWQNISQNIQSLKTVYKIDKRDAITQEMRQGNTKKILQLCDGRNRIEDIITLAKISAFDICEILESLTGLGVVRQATFDEVMGIVQIFESTNRTEKAVAFLEYAAQLDPENTEIIERLAQNFEEAKDPKKAAKYYSELAKTRKRELNLPEFEEHIKKAISLDKKEPGHRQVLIQHHLEKNNLEEAADAARQLAGLYFEMQSDEAAANLCELFFDKDEYSVEFRKLLINHYLRLKQKDKAIEQYEKLIDISNDDKQKMEYLQKILSVDPSRGDIRKKMGTLGVKRLITQYKWIILGLLIFVGVIGGGIVVSRSSANSERNEILLLSNSEKLKTLELVIQKLTLLKDSFWVGAKVKEDIKRIQNEMDTIASNISYKNYASLVGNIRKVLICPNDVKTKISEKYLLEAVKKLSLNQLETMENEAQEIAKNILSYIEKGDLEDRRKKKMTNEIWIIFKNEMELYTKTLSEEKLNRTNREKQEVLDSVEIVIKRAEELIAKVDKVAMAKIREKGLKEARKKLAAAHEKADKENSDNPFIKKFDKMGKRISEIEDKILELTEGDDTERAKKMLQRAATWIDPFGAADLERGIKEYEKTIIEIGKLKNLKKRNKVSFLESARKSLEKSKEELEGLQTLTLTYKEILGKPLDSQEVEELQLAYDTLSKLVHHRWYGWWSERLQLKGDPLKGFHWIESSPPNAYLYIDGELKGRTPKIHTFGLEDSFPAYEAQIKGFTPFSSILPEDRPWFVKLKLEKLPLWIYTKLEKTHRYSPGVIKERFLLAPQASQMANLELKKAPKLPEPYQTNKKILGGLDSYATPVLAFGKFIYVASNQGAIYKIDQASKIVKKIDLKKGKGKGKIKIAEGKSMAAFDNNLFVPTNKGVATIEIRGNELKQIGFWNTPGDLNDVTTGLLIADGRIYFGCEDQKLYSLKISSKGLSKSSKKTFNLSRPIKARPTFYEGRVIVAATRRIFCLNVDLDKKWEFNTDLTDSSGQVVTEGANFEGAAVVGLDADSDVLGRVFAADVNGDFFCLNLKNGNLFWRGSFNTATSKGVYGNPVLVENKTVYVGCLDGKIVGKNIFDKNPLPLLFSYENQEGFESSPLYVKAQEVVLFFDKKGKIIAFQP